jgi:hypothetical protein
VSDEGKVAVEIFDPPMCCPGGLCGPAIDPALLDINETLLRLRQEYDGQLAVERYLLPGQAGKFMAAPAVIQALQAGGAGVLPMALVNGRVLTRGRYPTYEELVEAIARET